RLIQSSAEVPKYCASRSAVSAVMPRLPCTISLIRRGGTPIETASLFCVMPKPSMKSFMRTSPAWIGSILSVVVNDLHLLRSDVRPHEPDTRLVVDPDAVLSVPIALEGLEPVSGRDAEVFERLRGPHLTQRAQCNPLDPRIDRSHAFTTPQPFGLLVAERSDHGVSV